MFMLPPEIRNLMYSFLSLKDLANTSATNKLLRGEIDKRIIHFKQYNDINLTINFFIDAILADDENTLAELNHLLLSKRQIAIELNKTNPINEKAYNLLFTLLFMDNQKIDFIYRDLKDPKVVINELTLSIFTLVDSPNYPFTFFFPYISHFPLNGLKSTVTTLDENNAEQFLPEFANALFIIANYVFEITINDEPPADIEQPVFDCIKQLKAKFSNLIDIIDKMLQATNTNLMDIDKFPIDSSAEPAQKKLKIYR